MSKKQFIQIEKVQKKKKEIVGHWLKLIWEMFSSIEM